MDQLHPRNHDKPQQNPHGNRAAAVVATFPVRPRAVWRFWLQWVLATALGFTMGLAMRLPVGMGLVFVLFQLRLIGIMGGISPVAIFTLSVGDATVLAASIGAAQWLVLRRYLAQADKWVLASVAGGTASGMVAASVMLGDAGEPELVFAPILGVALGLFHWWHLRLRIPGAGWYVLASMVAWTAAAAEYYALGNSTDSSLTNPYILFMDNDATTPAANGIMPVLAGLLPGAVINGAITGGALVWLLRSSARTETSP